MEQLTRLLIYISPIIIQFFLLLFIRKNLIHFNNGKSPINRILFLVLTLLSFLPIMNIILLIIIVTLSFLCLTNEDWLLRKEVKNKWWFN